MRVGLMVRAELVDVSPALAYGQEGNLIVAGEKFGDAEFAFVVHSCGGTTGSERTATVFDLPASGTDGDAFSRFAKFAFDFAVNDRLGYEREIEIT